MHACMLPLCAAWVHASVVGMPLCMPGPVDLISSIPNDRVELILYRSNILNLSWFSVGPISSMLILLVSTQVRSEFLKDRL